MARIQDKWFIDTYIAVNILDEIGGPYTIKKKKDGDNEMEIRVTEAEIRRKELTDV